MGDKHSTTSLRQQQPISSTLNMFLIVVAILGVFAAAEGAALEELNNFADGSIRQRGFLFRIPRRRDEGRYCDEGPRRGKLLWNEIERGTGASLLQPRPNDLLCCENV